MQPVHTLSATELAREIRAGRRSPVDVTDAVLARIADRNHRTNAFTTVTEELARDAAAAAARAIDTDEPLGPLHGVPIAIKDLNDVAGVESTYGSKLFEGFLPESDDVFVQRLRAAGAIIVGKTNTPEFGLGCTTDNRVTGPTGCPFDPTKIAGGSSGGAAAALADRLVPLAQGSDTGGSIRTPASCCGVFGLKPSFGRVPRVNRPNAFADHSPFSHTGPMARTVEDAALLLDVMAGPDPGDPFSLPATDTNFLDAIDQSIDTFSVAYSPTLGIYPVEPIVRNTVEGAVSALEPAVDTIDVVDPDIDATHAEVLDAFYTYAKVRWDALFDNLESQHDLVPRGEDREQLRRVTIKTIIERDPVSTNDLNRADVIRTTVYQGIIDLLETYDLLLTPTLGVPPFPHGEHPTAVAGTSIEPLRGWLLTQPFNFSGHPVGAVPAGTTADGLPIGLQVVGRRFAEPDVLAAAAAIERNRPWAHRYPE